MDRALEKICGLLQSQDSMRRCAAAIILGELAPKDSAVVKALGESLANANSMLIRYVLEAFEAIGSPDAAVHVLPLMDSDDMETKLRAIAVMSSAGGRIVPDIVARIEKATPSQKPLFVDALARIHTREAFRAILGLLTSPDFELVKQTCEAVRRHIATVPQKDRAALHQEVMRFMGTAAAKGNERVLTSSLLLLGYLARPEARALLLKCAAPKRSPYVRRHALIGLKNLELAGASANAVVRQIFPYLNDPDEGVARNALDILERHKGATPAQWLTMLESRHAAVRASAARALGESDTAAANRQLLRLLRHEDADLREIAGGALAAHKGAVDVLLKALAEESDAEASWRLAKILKPHSAAVDAAARKRFTTMAAADMQAGNPRYEARLYFLRNIDPKAADEVLREVGLEHRRAKRWAPAIECLRRLINTELFDDEVRYALCVANLKVSLKDLSPHARAEDHALRGFHALLRNREFKLVERLKKDKALDAADLYYVGFDFSESPGDEKAFGEKLLEHIAKALPRSEEGKAAKTKLKQAKG